MTDKTQSDELIGDQTREELYGKSLVQNLAKELTATYGSGFDFSSLYKYIRFYQCFPNILDTATPKSFLLDWSHYRTLLQVEDEKSATASQKSEKVYHRYLHCNVIVEMKNDSFKHEYIGQLNAYVAYYRANEWMRE